MLAGMAEKWLDLGYILEKGPQEYLDKLDVKGEEKRVQG